MNTVMAAFYDELEKIAVSSQLVARAADARIDRLRNLWTTPGMEETAMKGLAGTKTQLHRMTGMKVDLTKKLQSRADQHAAQIGRGASGGHVRAVEALTPRIQAARRDVGAMSDFESRNQRFLR